jgi:hypothetical protein
VLFNPSLEIQSTDNYIDWTSLTVCDLERVNWTSRTVPVGTDNPIDIATLTFSIPIWITSPAKVKKLGVVERIIAGIFDADGNASTAVTDNDLLLGTRQIFTPFGYQVLALSVGNDPYNLKLQVLTDNAVVDQSNDSLTPADSPPSNLLWHNVINMYGTLRPGISLIALEQDDGTEVYGTVSFDPTDDRFLFFTVDQSSTPPNTLAAVNAVINPQFSGPSNGLAPATEGQRYLLTDDTGNYDNPDNPSAWVGTDSRPLVAYANDIIEYTGDHWVVSFNSTSSPVNNQYVTNITTGLQYEWTGDMWIKSYQGLYPGGKWNIIL